ncbi:unnamed protein product [Rotaria sp. Silwood1]|nr:unnamed protein product [Rotaria sp. Silwood1]CAF1685098.1 unnamed protein product [Rotaria sp. Silwood1]
MTAGSISAPSIIPLRVGYTQKFSIDTNTLIEIRSDTNDVDIYYTLDGSKPDAFITLATRRSTIQYKKKPFYIPRDIANTGKVTIKAIAVSRDGIRESVIVTKIFDVKIIPSDHSLSDEYENRYLYELQQERKELMRKMQNENEKMQQKLSESMRRSTIDSLVQENPTNYTYSNSQIQTNVLRCAHCFAPKSNDLYTRFCTECGLSWQKLTHNPPDNYSTRILCPHCKSRNSIHLRTCYICENVLIPTSTSPEKRTSISVPTISKQTNTMMMTCSKCFRLNNPTARFCDWCSAYPDHASTSIQCTKCHTNNDSFAKFCSTCGCVLEPSLRIIDTSL